MCKFEFCVFCRVDAQLRGSSIHAQIVQRAVNITNVEKESYIYVGGGDQGHTKLSVRGAWQTRRIYISVSLTFSLCGTVSLILSLWMALLLLLLLQQKMLLLFLLLHILHHLRRISTAQHLRIRQVQFE